MSSSHRQRGLLSAWVGGLALGAVYLPGLCPACWPGYLGLLSSAGLGVSSPWIRSTAAFAALLLLAIVPLGFQIARRRAWDAAITALTGAVLLVEARWLGGSVGLQALGTVLLVASAAASTTRPAPATPTLISIKRRDETCERPC